MRKRIATAAAYCVVRRNGADDGNCLSYCRKSRYFYGGGNLDGGLPGCRADRLYTAGNSQIPGGPGRCKSEWHQQPESDQGKSQQRPAVSGERIANFVAGGPVILNLFQELSVSLPADGETSSA